jgi:Rab GDP dissociation inhibitor
MANGELTVAKVPSDAGEALRSSLMGLFEKRRAKKFLEWVGEFNKENPASHQGASISSRELGRIMMANWE